MVGYSGKPTSWGCMDKNLLDLAQADSRLIITTLYVILNIIPSTNSSLYISQSTANLLILKDKFREQISLDLQ